MTYDPKTSVIHNVTGAQHIALHTLRTPDPLHEVLAPGWFDPLASPLRAPDLAGLPPAHVITAEFDPLRDEGEAYAARLAQAGVAVDAVRYDGMFHGFVSMFELLDQGKTALAVASERLRAALSR